MEHKEYPIQNIDVLKRYFYEQGRRIHYKEEAGSLDERKTAIAEHLRTICNTSWHGTYGLRVDIWAPDANQALISRSRLPKITRHHSSQGDSRTSEGGRPMAWMVEVFGSSRNSFFADAQSGRIGIYQKLSNIEVYDFYENEDRTLSECEDFLSNIFYPGSLPEAFMADPNRLFEIVPLDFLA